MCDDFLHEFLDYSQGYIYLLKHIQISSFISKCPASCLFPPSDDVLFLCIWNWLDMWYLQSEDFHSPFLSTLLSQSLFRKMIVLTVGFLFQVLSIELDLWLWSFGIQCPALQHHRTLSIYYWVWLHHIPLGWMNLFLKFSVGLWRRKINSFWHPAFIFRKVAAFKFCGVQCSS